MLKPTETSKLKNFGKKLQQSHSFGYVFVASDLDLIEKKHLGSKIKN